MRRLLEVTRQNPYLFLTLGLLANFLLFAVPPSPWRSVLMLVAYVYIIGAGTHAISGVRRHMRVFTLVAWLVAKHMVRPGRT